MLIIVTVLVKHSSGRPSATSTCITMGTWSHVICIFSFDQCEESETVFCQTWWHGPPRLLTPLFIKVTFFTTKIEENACRAIFFFCMFIYFTVVFLFIKYQLVNLFISTLRPVAVHQLLSVWGLGHSELRGSGSVIVGVRFGSLCAQGQWISYCRCEVWVTLRPGAVHQLL